MNNTRKTRKARHKPDERLKREYQTSPVPEKVRVIFYGKHQILHLLQMPHGDDRPV